MTHNRYDRRSLNHLRVIFLFILCNQHFLCRLFYFLLQRYVKFRSNKLRRIKINLGIDGAHHSQSISFLIISATGLPVFSAKCFDRYRIAYNCRSVNFYDLNRLLFLRPILFALLSDPVFVVADYANLLNPLFLPSIDVLILTALTGFLTGLTAFCFGRLFPRFFYAAVLRHKVFVVVNRRP